MRYLDSDTDIWIFLDIFFLHLFLYLFMHVCIYLFIYECSQIQTTMFLVKYIALSGIYCVLSISQTCPGQDFEIV